MAVASWPVENGVVVLLVCGRLATDTNSRDHRQVKGTCQHIATCVPQMALAWCDKESPYCQNKFLLHEIWASEKPCAIPNPKYSTTFFYFHFYKLKCITKPSVQWQVTYYLNFLQFLIFSFLNFA